MTNAVTDTKDTNVITYQFFNVAFHQVLIFVNNFIVRKHYKDVLKYDYDSQREKFGFCDYNYMINNYG